MYITSSRQISLRHVLISTVYKVTFYTKLVKILSYLYPKFIKLNSVTTKDDHIHRILLYRNILEPPLQRVAGKNLTLI